MRMRVDEIMTAEVTSVGVETPFKNVAEILIERGISAVPVVDADRHVIGVVSEADLLPKEEYKAQNPLEDYRPPLRARLRHHLTPERGKALSKSNGDTAAELMTTPAITVRPQLAVVLAMRLMDEHGITYLPVVDAQDRLVGILSRHDLIKVFVRTDDEIAHEIQEEVLDHYPWLDTSQVEVEVNRGIVILSGRTRTRTQTSLVARSTMGVNGVIDVLYELLWDEDDT
jgi:CBS domain-containing protein